jgi:hypothetical protein
MEAADAVGEGELDGDLGTSDQSLLGDTSFDSSCETGEAAFGRRALNAARFVAVSTGFRECIDVTVRTAKSLRRYGGTVTMGPYVSDADDPCVNSTLGPS